MLKTIYLAGGCFWGTAHLFSLVPGVVSATAGYANSSVPNPTYRQVCSGATGAAETVKVEYDSDCVSLPELIDLFVESVDPTSVNQQGNDVGTQYRTGIYYTDPADSSVIDSAMDSLNLSLNGLLAVEHGRLINFYPAEEYHQQYLYKHPGGYCHIGPALMAKAKVTGCPSRQPATRRFSRPDDATLRSRLTPLQWEVTQHSATEPPHANEYARQFAPGIYVDITTGEPLFLSTHKYDSGCGWPAFTRPISPGLVKELPDNSHSMTRTEVRSAHSGAHLGHVFTDGPASEGGMRYCINSASLRFIPRDSMAAQGYSDFLHLLP